MITTMDAHVPPPCFPPMIKCSSGCWRQWLDSSGCLLVGIQAGYIPAEGGRIVIGRTVVASLTTHLLMEAQVQRLPEQPYDKDADIIRAPFVLKNITRETRYECCRARTSFIRNASCHG